MRSTILPHVQCDQPDIPIKIDKVCVKGIYRRICLNTDDSSICLNARINACIDLPKNQKGIHVSRNVETILETLGETRFTGFKKLEEALRNITHMLLNKHNYAYRAEASISTLYLYKYGDERISNYVDEIPVTLVLRDVLLRDGYEEVTIGVKMRGMTVCPCAQQVYAAMENLSLPNAPSHSQRAMIYLGVKVHGGDSDGIDLNNIIKAALDSFSAPVLNFLKRDSEYRLVKKAFENPRFVEDVTRHAIYNVYKILKDSLKDDDKVFVKVVSYESIHPFNLYSYSTYKVKELRELDHLSNGINNNSSDIINKSC